MKTPIDSVMSFPVSPFPGDNVRMIAPSIRSWIWTKPCKYFKLVRKSPLGPVTNIINLFGLSDGAAN